MSHVLYAMYVPMFFHKRGEERKRENEARRMNIPRYRFLVLFFSHRLSDDRFRARIGQVSYRTN